MRPVARNAELVERAAELASSPSVRAYVPPRLMTSSTSPPAGLSTRTTGHPGRSACWSVCNCKRSAWQTKGMHVTRRCRSRVGDYIREQRRQAQISMRQLAQQARVSNPYLSQIKAGPAQAERRHPAADRQGAAASPRKRALHVQAKGILEDGSEAGRQGPVRPCWPTPRSCRSDGRSRFSPEVCRCSARRTRPPPKPGPPRSPPRPPPGSKLLRKPLPRKPPSPRPRLRPRHDHGHATIRAAAEGGSRRAALHVLVCRDLLRPSRTNYPVTPMTFPVKTSLRLGSVSSVFGAYTPA